MTEEVKVKKTKNEYIQLMKNVLVEIGTLQEDLKRLKDEAKENSHDSTLLAKVAGALAAGKADDIIEKAELFAATVEAFDIGDVE